MSFQHFPGEGSNKGTALKRDELGRFQLESVLSSRTPTTRTSFSLLGREAATKDRRLVKVGEGEEEEKRRHGDER